MNFMEILLIYNVMYRHINFFFYGNENIFAYHYTLQAHTHKTHACGPFHCVYEC